MLRNILAAIAGYIVMALVLFAAMTVSWMGFGVDGAFQPGSWEVTGGWIAVSIVVGLVAAVVGGYTCKWIGRTERAVQILLGIVVVLGLLTIVSEMAIEKVASGRPDEVPMFEAMANGIQPGWLTWLNPILGVVGVLYGARLKGGSAAETDTAGEAA